jgi:hypothetical protein
LGAEEVQVKDAISQSVFNITTFSPEGEVLEENVQMALESPVEGIYVIPGFTRDEVLGYIKHFIDALAEEIMQETIPPTLIFPLDGAVLAYELLMTRLAELEYEHLRDLEVLFAAKTGGNEYIVHLYRVREGARVIIVDDIADRLGAFEAISRAINHTPELYAMSRKATTAIGQFDGYLIRAVFPLINGEDPWCNSGFGMNKDSVSSTRVRALERLALVCVIGTATSEEAYIEFLVARIFRLLEEIDQRRPEERLFPILEAYHKSLLIELLLGNSILN